ncbi:TPA: helix-turn-helix transcriptional regulator [Enterobacter asburiae]
MNDSTISSFLGVSIKTIYSHRRNIMLKLKTKNRTNLWKIINTIK